MNLTGGIVLYAVLWFLVLLIVALIGQSSQAEDGHVVPGTPPGAPAAAFSLKRKVLQTTVITTVLWGLCAWLILGGFISREELSQFDMYFRG